MGSYTVFSDGCTIQGNARSILEQVLSENAKHNDELAKMTVQAYAQALIDDAPYFLPADLYAALEQESFPSEFDRALAYLDQMPTSGVRILKVTSVA